MGQNTTKVESAQKTVEIKIAEFEEWLKGHRKRNSPDPLEFLDTEPVQKVVSTIDRIIERIANVYSYTEDSYDSEGDLEAKKPEIMPEAKEAIFREIFSQGASLFESPVILITQDDILPSLEKITVFVEKVLGKPIAELGQDIMQLAESALRSGTNELENQVLSYLPWGIHLDSGYIKDMTSDILASIDPTKVNSGKTRIYTLLCNGYKGQLGKDEMAVDPTTWGITVIKTIDHILQHHFYFDVEMSKEMGWEKEEILSSYRKLAESKESTKADTVVPSQLFNSFTVEPLGKLEIN